MRHKSERHQDAAERSIKDIRRKTRKRYSSEEKIRIVPAGLRGEDSIAELCRQEGISQGMYYSWSKEFLEAGISKSSGRSASTAIGLRSKYSASSIISLIASGGSLKNQSTAAIEFAVQALTPSNVGNLVNGI